MDCIKKGHISLYLIKDLAYFLHLYIIVIPNLFRNGVVGLCTSSADLSTEFRGFELEGKSSCVGFDDVDT